MVLGTDITGHIINSLPGIFYLFDAEGTFLLWNRTFETASGYSAEEIRGMHPVDFFFEEEKEYMAARIQRVFRAGKADAQAFFRNKDGSRTPYFFTGSLIGVNDRPCVIGMGMNISERVQAEEALRESEEMYRMIVETSQEGIWMIDQDDRTTFVNERMARMFGYSKEEMIGLPLYHFMGEAEAVIAAQNVARRKSGISEQHEFRFLKKNGEPIWTLLNTNPIFKKGVYQGALAMSIDITERKEAENRLVSSEKKFRSLVQNSSDAITVLDGEGKYLYVSPAVERILGHAPDTLLQKNALQFVHPDDRDRVGVELGRLLQLERIENVLYRFLHANGSWRWLESYGSNQLRDEVIGGLVINTRDITERIHLQERLNSIARENQKNITAAIIRTQEKERSQIGQELHDNVNQVLTTVKLYTELIGDGVGDRKELISKSMFLLQDCIDEIRSISKRLSAPTLGAITLEDSIRELAESINLTKKVEIQVRVTGLHGVEVPQDMHLALYRITQEQLNNVLKYAFATSASINIHLEDQFLNLKIEDNGRGFDPNLKTAGIGIANMKIRAENLNGFFGIRSIPGSGCTVSVRIPFSM